MKQVIGIATTTCPDKETASNIVESLLADGLIACGQVEGPIESTYFWNGKLTKELEWRMLLKFAPEKTQQLEGEVMKLHPYENPQWTNWEASAGDDYHEWVVNPNPQEGEN